VILGFGDTQRIETLVALNGKLLLDEEYMATVTQMANKKLEKSRNKMERVRVAIENKLSAMTKTLPSFEVHEQNKNEEIKE
jgi:tRNA(Phe) wybutosine-synthesizing methylase Tyw3